MEMVGEILSKIYNLGSSHYSVPESTCFCSGVSCKNMMVSFSCLISFSSLVSKLGHHQLFRASYATVSFHFSYHLFSGSIIWSGTVLFQMFPSERNPSAFQFSEQYGTIAFPCERSQSQVAADGHCKI